MNTSANMLIISLESLVMLDKLFMRYIHHTIHFRYIIPQIEIHHNTNFQFITPTSSDIPYLIFFELVFTATFTFLSIIWGRGGWGDHHP